ncbi:amidophosphoribosyltransferase [Candidatus Woesearchaeota archaeon]|nr:amidophosphoribosyltransferase [Candidatus Woesearchaeota archaeon]
MCGVVGVYNVENAARTALEGLRLLQHRGQDGAGLVVALPDGTLERKRGRGDVQSIFSDPHEWAFPGRAAIAHTRYATQGEQTEDNIQPIKSATFFPFQIPISIAHNGNFSNFLELQQRLGGFYQTTTDTEIIFHLMHNSPERDLEKRILDAAAHVDGSYSMLILTSEKLYAMRDPAGFRPLIIGRIGDGFIVSSERYGFGRVGADVVRDVNPGEMVVFEGNQMLSRKIGRTSERKYHCIFELVYFANPAETQNRVEVSEFRFRSGMMLYGEEEHPARIDVVVPVMDSGLDAAYGYHKASGIDLVRGIYRNHHVGRTFIQPTQEERRKSLREKQIPVSAMIKGKRIKLVDDSIVRGNTTKGLVKMARDAGALEVHVGIASPPVRWVCEFGIANGPVEDLIARTYEGNVERVREYIDADTLTYLSVPGLLKATGMGDAQQRYCTYCLTGEKPEF